MQQNMANGFGNVYGISTCKIVAKVRTVQKLTKKLNEEKIILQILYNEKSTSCTASMIWKKIAN